jgi:hypothetical protein
VSGQLPAPPPEPASDRGEARPERKAEPATPAPPAATGTGKAGGPAEEPLPSFANAEAEAAWRQEMQHYQENIDLDWHEQPWRWRRRWPDEEDEPPPKPALPEGG